MTTPVTGMENVLVPVQICENIGGTRPGELVPRWIEKGHLEFYRSLFWKRFVQNVTDLCGHGHGQQAQSADNPFVLDHDSSKFEAPTSLASKDILP